MERGRWHDTLSFYEKDGEPILRREQGIDYLAGTGTVIQLEEVNRDTLAPRCLNIRNANELPHTEIFYQGNLIRGTKLVNVEGLAERQRIPIQFSLQLPEPVFDWHLWGILVSGFPLQPDYQAQFLTRMSSAFWLG